MATQDVDMQEANRADTAASTMKEQQTNCFEADSQMSEKQESLPSEYAYVAGNDAFPPPLPASGASSWSMVEPPSTPVAKDLVGDFVVPNLPGFENVAEVLAQLETLSQELESKREKLDAAEVPPPAGWVKATPFALPSPLEQRVRIMQSSKQQDWFETINTEEQFQLDSATAQETRDLTLVEFNTLAKVLQRDSSPNQPDKNQRIADLIRSYVPLKRQLQQERIWQGGVQRVKTIASGHSTPRPFTARRPRFRCTECKAPHVAKDIPVKLDSTEGDAFRVKQKACLNCGSKDKNGVALEYTVEKIPHVSLQATHQGKEGVFYLDIVHRDGVDELEWTFYPDDGDAQELAKQHPVQVDTLGVALPPAQNLIPGQGSPPCATDFISMDERPPAIPCPSVEVLAWHPMLEEAEELRVMAADTLEELKNDRLRALSRSQEQAQEQSPKEQTLAESSDTAPEGESSSSSQNCASTGAKKRSRTPERSTSDKQQRSSYKHQKSLATINEEIEDVVALDAAIAQGRETAGVEKHRPDIAKILHERFQETAWSTLEEKMRTAAIKMVQTEKQEKQAPYKITYKMPQAPGHYSVDASLYSRWPKEFHDLAASGAFQPDVAAKATYFKDTKMAFSCYKACINAIDQCSPMNRPDWITESFLSEVPDHEGTSSFMTFQDKLHFLRQCLNGCRGQIRFASSQWIRVDKHWDTIDEELVRDASKTTLPLSVIEFLESTTAPAPLPRHWDDYEDSEEQVYDHNSLRQSYDIHKVRKDRQDRRRPYAEDCVGMSLAMPRANKDGTRPDYYFERRTRSWHLPGLFQEFASKYTFKTLMKFWQSLPPLRGMYVRGKNTQEKMANRRMLHQEVVSKAKDFLETLTHEDGTPVLKSDLSREEIQLLKHHMGLFLAAKTLVTKTPNYVMRLPVIPGHDSREQMEWRVSFDERLTVPTEVLPIEMQEFFDKGFVIVEQYYRCNTHVWFQDDASQADKDYLGGRTERWGGPLAMSSEETFPSGVAMADDEVESERPANSTARPAHIPPNVIPPDSWVKGSSKTKVYRKVECGLVLRAASGWHYQVKEKGVAAKNKWICKYCKGTWAARRGGTRLLMIYDGKVVLQVVVDEPPEAEHNAWVVSRMELMKRLEPNAPVRDAAPTFPKAESATGHKRIVVTGAESILLWKTLCTSSGVKEMRILEQLAEKVDMFHDLMTRTSSAA